ncbi:hypothetical protein [Lederbergia lenta]|uniref:Galactose-1-phosphate uridylyltransferase n=1 Tax=Lederbergia lenta TaxID=1467 RepID=A0A2X4WEC3_LEDLE|nr:hypothetical protein [Lederbergia lenta]MCM3109484.1 hypothetical protein [Lederbergia lenta]MEC2324762.1 hypothetical protein [Lederbergia lenta]SQI58218.1 Uncharacterised protein [Lederbergia lenta]
MTIHFKKAEEWFTFYDGQGNLIERKTEIRFDPLTGESSRLVFDAGLSPVLPNYTEAAEQSGGKNCPFCPENILKMTPVFPKEITFDDRITQGEAIVFPNLFPYSKHNGVVVFSGQHYVRLEEFTTQLIKNAFIAAQTYIQNVIKTDSKVSFASINWNYLPESGGSILHPHLHVIASESPTNYQAITNEKENQYKKENGTEYFSDLYETEKTLDERWIGECDSVAWVHAYAPKSHNDFIGIFTQASNIHNITEQDWLSFSESLTKIFATLNDQGFASFNLSLHVSTDPEAKQPIHVRLIPRLTIGQLETSDINFFQALHQEPLTYKSPEDITRKAHAHFNSRIK